MSSQIFNSAPASSETNPNFQTPSKAVLKLIDSCLPLEACLHYQIIPLSIKGQSILLGMVNPRDIAALNYVRPIVNSLNYVFKPQQIDSKTHQKLLSAYLHFLNGQKTEIPDLKPPKALDIGERPTLITDQPEDFKQPEAMSMPLSLVEKIEKKISQSHHQKNNLQLLKTLDLSPCYHSAPPEILAELSPKNLLPELLDRVLCKGIGRIHLERNPQGGNIICSQDGIEKLTMYNLGNHFFQALINECKTLVLLPKIPIQKDKKIEMLRLYQNEPILLRWHFIASPYGEELSLQVLRGTALEFYQKYQIDKLGQEALHLTEQLEQKIKQLKSRSQYNDFVPDKLLSEINGKLVQIQSEIDSLNLIS